MGVVDGLAALLQMFPGFLPLKDPHLLAFLSELLKMSSVADGDMTDESLKDSVVDRNGFAVFTGKYTPQYPSHSSALFFRRMCVVRVDGLCVVVPDEQPAGVQLRVSTIMLLHSVIRGYADLFFDSGASTPVGE